MSGQCLSSSSLPGSLDSCPHCPRERMRTRISTLTVRGAPHAQPPRPPRVVLAPRALEPEEGPASDPRKLPRGSPARQPLLHPCSRPGGQERDPTPGPRGSCSCHPAAGPRDAGVRGHVGAGSGWQVGGGGTGTWARAPAPWLLGLSLAQNGRSLPSLGPLDTRSASGLSSGLWLAVPSGTQTSLAKFRPPARWREACPGLSPEGQTPLGPGCMSPSHLPSSPLRHAQPCPCSDPGLAPTGEGGCRWPEVGLCPPRQGSPGPGVCPYPQAVPIQAL